MKQPHSVSPPQAPRAVSVGLSGVGQAFWRALVSQVHPRMLFALLMPFLIMLVGAILLMLFALSPLKTWLNQMLSETSALIAANEWLVSKGLFSLEGIQSSLVFFIVLMVLLPISGILGLTVAAIFVMPLVVTHVSRQHFPALALQGQNALVVSVWNAVWVSVVFVLGWILTLPFWLFPPLGLLVSLL
ncbi:MAG: EI24 domain-containing protein, partial [Zwartia sp.]